jgi:hypothetical protein
MFQSILNRGDDQCYMYVAWANFSNGKISILRPQGYLLAPEWPVDINHVTHTLEAVADYTNPYYLNGLGMM